MIIPMLIVHIYLSEVCIIKFVVFSSVESDPLHMTLIGHQRAKIILTIKYELIIYKALHDKRVH